MRVICVLGLLWLAGACAQITQETRVIEDLTDNGCRIDRFETKDGPRGRSSITVDCK